MGRNAATAYLTTYVITASLNYFFVKFGLRYSAPLGFMTLRYLLAGAILALVVLIRDGNYTFMVNRDVILASIFSALSTALWAYGLVYVDPGTSAVLSYTMPLLAIPLSVVLAHERPRAVNVIGAAVGFIGVVIYGVFSIIRGVPLVGALLTLVNAVFWALYSIYYRRLRDYDGLTVVSNTFLIGTLVLALAGFLVGGPRGLRIEWTWAFIENLLGTAVIGGAVLFLVWYLAIRNLGVSRVVSYIFMVPVMTLILNYLILGIEPTPPELVGSAIMFLGIYLASKS